MKRISVVLLILTAAFCAPLFMEAQTPEIFRQEGIASWYGPEFDGRPTASGEVFNSSLLTAAHPTLPFGTLLAITNKHNNKQVTVRVNDRGPFVSARIIDVSKAAAEQLDMIITGTAPVIIESIERIVTPGSGRTTATVPDSYWTLPPDSGTAAAPAVSAAPSAPAQVYVQPPVSPAVPATPAPAYTPPPAAPAQTYVPAPAYTPVPQVTPPPVAYPQQPAPVVQPAAPQGAYVPPLPQAAPAAAPVPAPQVTARQESAQTAPDKTYRIQVGAYKIPKNAVDAYEKLKNAGLNPAYERNGEYFRVVLAGVRGTEVQSVTEKLGIAGFREVLVREEH
jgi:rare lipoprotein A